MNYLFLSSKMFVSYPEFLQWLDMPEPAIINHTPPTLSLKPRLKIVEEDRSVGRPAIIKDCEEPGCEKKHLAKGLCKYHYDKKYRETHKRLIL